MSSFIIDILKVLKGHKTAMKADSVKALLTHKIKSSSDAALFTKDLQALYENGIIGSRNDLYFFDSNEGVASSECDDKYLMLKDTDLSTASPTVPAVVVTPPSQDQGKPEFASNQGVDPVIDPDQSSVSAESNNPVIDPDQSSVSAESNNPVIDPDQSSVSAESNTLKHPVTYSPWIDEEKSGIKRKAERDLNQYIKRRTISRVSNEEFYRTCSVKGLCIIYNNSKFDPDLNLSERIGSEVDTENLKEIFQSRGFDVAVHIDYTANEIKNKTMYYSRLDLSKYGSLVIILSSHGRQGYLFGRDEKFLAKDILTFFTSTECTSMIDKPKLFILECCQGSNTDPVLRKEIESKFTDKVKEESDESEEQYSWTPAACDFAVFLSTMFGYISYISEKSGTRFLRTLCKILDEHEVLEIYELHLKISEELSTSFVKNKKGEIVAQTPVFLSTLRKLFIL